jgi:hypothetical protein
MSTLLTAGCSLTKDNYQKIWANYLALELQATLSSDASPQRLGKYSTTSGIT